MPSPPSPPPPPPPVPLPPPPEPPRGPYSTFRIVKVLTSAGDANIAGKIPYEGGDIVVEDAVCYFKMWAGGPDMYEELVDKAIRQQSTNELFVFTKLKKYPQPGQPIVMNDWSREELATLYDKAQAKYWGVGEGYTDVTVVKSDGFDSAMLDTIERAAADPIDSLTAGLSPLPGTMFYIGSAPGIELRKWQGTTGDVFWYETVQYVYYKLGLYDRKEFVLFTQLNKDDNGEVTHEAYWGYRPGTNSQHAFFLPSMDIFEEENTLNLWTKWNF